MTRLPEYAARIEANARRLGLHYNGVDFELVPERFMMETAVYGLPAAPKMPSRNLKPSAVWSAIGAAVIGLMGVISFRNRGRGDA